MSLNLCPMGQVPYDQALDLQWRLLSLRQQDRIGDTLLSLEHPPVITLGTRGKKEHIYLSAAQLAKRGITVHQVGRGGDVTYHGPGQLILYPILKLYDRPGGIRQFIQTVENSVIDYLDKAYQITAQAGDGKFTGLWVDDAKIMAVGLAVKQGVTMHGFALNLSLDLTPFSYINPCGLQKPVTSVAKLCPDAFDAGKKGRKISQSVAAAIDDEVICLTPAELTATLQQAEEASAKETGS